MILNSEMTFLVLELIKRQSFRRMVNDILAKNLNCAVNEKQAFFKHAIIWSHL